MSEDDDRPGGKPEVHLDEHEVGSQDEIAGEGASGHHGVPSVPAAAAVAVAGVLSGSILVAAVWLSARGCDMVRDTPNCGALGLPLLVATVAVAIAGGHHVLRRLRVASAGLVSFLGVCFMLAVVVGLFADRLTSVWSAVVVPVLSVATFLVAFGVTRRLGG